MIDATAEKALWVAVVMQAIEDLRDTRQGDNVAQNREAARKWLTNNSQKPCGFVWTMNCLGLDVDAFREKIGLVGA